MELVRRRGYLDPKFFSIVYQYCAHFVLDTCSQRSSRKKVRAPFALLPLGSDKSNRNRPSSLPVLVHKPLPRQSQLEAVPETSGMPLVLSACDPWPL
jgi:hypothetical protein